MACGSPRLSDFASAWSLMSDASTFVFDVPAFARFMGAPTIVMAHDMRESGKELTAAFADGVTSQGVDVINAGLGSTDLLYFAAGSLDMPGAMFTASHNPAKYNGIKLCRAGASPVGQDTGLADIRRDVEEGAAPSGGARPGKVESRDLLREYAAYLRRLVDLSGSRPLKVVVDAGNGMGGYTVPSVFEGLPIEIVPMYFELDGSFPNHDANPLDPKNIEGYQRLYEVQLAAGDPRKALPTLERANSVQSDDPQFWTQLGKLYASIVLKPDALTRLMRAWVTTGLPHAVSLGMPLALASSWLPRFQPAPMSAPSWGALSRGQPFANPATMDPRTFASASGSCRRISASSRPPAPRA